MKWIISLLLLSMLILAGCSSELPPEPDSPGATGNYYKSIDGDWAIESDTFSVVHDEYIICSEGETVDISLKVEGDDFVYSNLYMWGDGSRQWEIYDFTEGDFIPSSKWVRGTATFGADMLCEDLVRIADENDEVFVVAYSCSREGSTFDCNNNKWQLQIFNVIQEDYETYCEPTDVTDIYTKGGISGMIAGDPYVYEDSCLDENVVVKNSCDGDLAVSSTTECAFGCYDGACLTLDAPGNPEGFKEQDVTDEPVPNSPDETLADPVATQPEITSNQDDSNAQESLPDYSSYDTTGYLVEGDVITGTLTPEVYYAYYNVSMIGPSQISYSVNYDCSYGKQFNARATFYDASGKRLDWQHNWAEQPKAAYPEGSVCNIKSSFIDQRHSPTTYADRVREFRENIETMIPYAEIHIGGKDLQGSGAQKTPSEYTLSINKIFCLDGAISFDGTKQCTSGDWGDLPNWRDIPEQEVNGIGGGSMHEKLAPVINPGESSKDYLSIDQQTVYYLVNNSKSEDIYFKITWLDDSCDDTPVSFRLGTRNYRVNVGDCSYIAKSSSDWVDVENGLPVLRIKPSSYSRPEFGTFLVEIMPDSTLYDVAKEENRQATLEALEAWWMENYGQVPDYVYEVFG